MSGHFARKFTDEQRQAVIEERGRTGDSYRLIAERAAAGSLLLDGEPVGAFSIEPYYCGELYRAHERKMRGIDLRDLGRMGHGDAMESVRKRLLALTEHQLQREERAVSKNKDIDPAKIQALAKAAREIAHLDPDPAPGGRRPPPGKRTGTGTNSGTGNGVTPTSGLAGEIMRDHRASAARAHQTDEEAV